MRRWLLLNLVIQCVVANVLFWWEGVIPRLNGGFAVASLAGLGICQFIEWRNKRAVKEDPGMHGRGCPCSSCQSFFVNAVPLAHGYNSAVTYVTNTTSSRPRLRFTGKAVDHEGAIYGWRVYSLAADGTLSGARQSWPTKEMKAVCLASHNTPPDEMIRGMLGDDVTYRLWLERRGDNSRQRQQCLDHLEHDSCPQGCGIWGQKYPCAGLIMARCLAYGTVALDEDGNWRASDVEIESLYILKAAIENFAFSRIITESGVGPLTPYIDWDRLAVDLGLRYDVPAKVIEDVSELAVGAGA